MNISNRHHYIPKFFIKEFIGSDGKLSVYNCKSKEIDPIRKSPKQVFFEWHRNSFEVDNEHSDFVEKLYKKVEDRFAPIYKEITKDIEHYELTPYDMFHIIHYIGVLHASLPVNDKQVEDFIKNSNKEDLGIKIMDTLTKNESEDANSIYDEYKKEPAFVQSAKIIKAITDYLRSDAWSSIKNWKPYYSRDNNQPHLLGDNPIILRDSEVNSIYDTEILFPLSKEITIFNTNGKDLIEIPAKDVVMIDVLTVLQANRMVCGPDEGYLKIIVELAKKFPNKKTIDYAKEQIFKQFD